MTQVFVTGGTGFVGRHVCRELICSGYNVVAIVRKGSSERLPDGIAQIVEVDDLFTQTSDWWAGIFTARSYVIHLAWTATPGQYINDPANLKCLAGTLSLAEGAIAAGVAKFTGIGTCIEYRMGDALLDIDTPLDPQSPYAYAKAAAFTSLSTSLDQTGTGFAWCRLFGLFGEGEHPDRLIASLHHLLAKGHYVPLSDGTQIRDFLNVTHAARNICCAALGPIVGALNICSGIGISVRDKAVEIATSYGRVDLLRIGVRPNNTFDPARIVGVPTKL
jgi:nucleoside-diphosphate-sugar epimerase